MPSDPLADHSAHLLRALDFASETAVRDEEHRQEMTRLLGSLLDVVDSLDRYLADEPASAPSLFERDERGSVRLIARQLERALQQAGLTPVSCLGQPFDPERHEAVETRHTKECADQTIVEVVTRGFDWGGCSLRRPRVVVARSGE